MVYGSGRDERRNWAKGLFVWGALVLSGTAGCSAEFIECGGPEHDCAHQRSTNVARANTPEPGADGANDGMGGANDVAGGARADAGAELGAGGASVDGGAELGAAGASNADRAASGGAPAAGS
ncbi:MAG TPA: hypothetical protein VHU80_00870, partial [Polyangiaceae bacterium]|nr:hypothetical protein [Polyangiaceae bacterium]